jgi:hypothetical protein
LFVIRTNDFGIRELRIGLRSNVWMSEALVRMCIEL